MKFVNIEEVYDQNKGLKKEDVMSLQEWMSKQPHLPTITELQLVLFLHSCYYSVSLAKTTIDNFYTYRVHCPEFFSNRSPTFPSLKKALDVILFIDLPKKTPEGYKVLFCKIMDYDAGIYMFTDHAKLFDMCVMQWLHEEGPAEGLIVVVDMGAFNFGHLMKMHIMAMKKILMYLQEALPVRLKGIHYINVGSVIDGLMSLIKPFLKKEVSDNFHFHDTQFDKLFNYVPKECLPKEYGGSVDSTLVLHETMKKHFMENKEYFEEDERLVADESKRLGKPKHVDDIFGIEGSFKKLDVD